MDWMPYFTTDASVLHGAVRFTGTRIPVTVVLDNLADGATAAAILAQYPSLRSEHVAVLCVLQCTVTSTTTLCTRT